MTNSSKEKGTSAGDRSSTRIKGGQGDRGGGRGGKATGRGGAASKVASQNQEWNNYPSKKTKGADGSMVDGSAIETKMDAGGERGASPILSPARKNNHGNKRQQRADPVLSPQRENNQQDNEDGGNQLRTIRDFFQEK